MLKFSDNEINFAKNCLKAADKMGKHLTFIIFVIIITSGITTYKKHATFNTVLALRHTGEVF